MVATATAPVVETKLVNLVFEVPKEGLHVMHMSEVLSALWSALHHLDPQLATLDEHLGNGSGGVFVVSTSLNSPWTVLIALANLPERAVNGFKRLLLNLVFYEQEKRKRDGLAAQELAKAHQLHLANLREAISIARELEVSQVSLTEVRDLFEATGPLHRSPAKLIAVREEN